MPGSATVYRGKKTHKNNSNKAKANKIAHIITVKFNNLALALHVELAKVRASPGAIECFRSPLTPPVPHAHVFRNSHPIPSILANNSGCDPLPFFAFLRGTAPKASSFF